MQGAHKYARLERERRFLVGRFPVEGVGRIRRITDRYIEGTRLRLRELTEDAAPTTYKLTQKIAARGTGGQQGFITTIYLTGEEFRLLAQLPAKLLTKIRHSAPPFGIDIFEGALEGLRLAEAEFDSAPEADALIVPDFIGPEVTGDVRFTGGQLACASRQQVAELLAEYGYA